jgi:hypothetical protein
MADTPVTPPSIPSWPTPPSRSDEPAEFITEADAFVAAFPTQTTAFNALAANVLFNAESAFDSAAEAVVSVGLAEDEADEAAAQAALSAGYAGDSLSSSVISAGAANLKGAWDDQTGAATKPYSVTHVGRIWVLLNNLADVTASEPGVTADWFSVGTMAIQERSFNVILAADDYGANIKYTGAGGFTQTLQPVASMVDGWYVYVRNDTSGNITLNPDGTETIDGLTSFIMYPGEMRLIELNAAGTGFESTVINGFTVTFDSSGTFTKPPGYQAFKGIAWSAGASGDRDASASSGGHGGGAFPFVIATGEVGATETITIGAGGAGRTTNGASNPGGNTSIGSIITVLGATATTSGGIVVDQSSSGFSGGTSSGFGGTTQVAGGFGGVWGGSCSSSNATTASGNSVYGGAAGGSHDGTLRAAGTSIFGGNGGAAGDATNGTDGAQPGGGGGATRTGTQSGKGGDGRVVIRGVI